MTIESSDCTESPGGLPVKIHTVERPPTWRAKPYRLSYVLTKRETTHDELITLLRWAAASDMPNPRVITPKMVQWSSLFHPRFFKSIYRNCPTPVEPLTWVDNSLPLTFNELSRLWLQSVLFLSSVTLSAAIIQHRFSSGTIGSKFDRLWDAGSLSASGVAPELASLQLHTKVLALHHDRMDDIEKLLAIRRTFMQALERIAPAPGNVERMRKHIPASYPAGRFGFVDDLRRRLGNDIRAIIVYGSSVSSNHFADIDAVVIVDDPESALLKLAGTSPTWQGTDLNLGIYSPSEFLVMQRLSGDNLRGYGVCIWGEVEIVNKPVSELLARNFSFGIVRQRQQLGMLSRAVTSMENLGSDRQSLYEYFVKIPANVVKGTLGAVGQRLPKEQVHDWLHSTVGFDTPQFQKQAISGNAIGALASSSLATGDALIELNSMLRVVHT